MYWIYPIFSLFWAAFWLYLVYTGQIFQTMPGNMVGLMVWIGLGALVVFVITSSLSLIRIADYRRWLWIARICLAINILTSVLAGVLASVLAGIFSNCAVGFFIFLFVLGLAMCLFYYEFSNNELDQAGRNNSIWHGQPHRNFFIGLILPVLMGVSFLLTSYAWEMKSDANIAWAQKLEIIQFRGEVLIQVEDENDCKVLLKFLYFNNNPNQKIRNYNLLIQKHITSVGKEEIIHFTYDGTKYNEPLYFRSGDREIRLKIEKRVIQ